MRILPKPVNRCQGYRQSKENAHCRSDQPGQLVGGGNTLTEANAWHKIISFCSVLRFRTTNCRSKLISRPFCRPCIRTERISPSSLMWVWSTAAVTACEQKSADRLSNKATVRYFIACSVKWIYSLRKLFTGFLSAAFTVWKLTDNSATVMAPKPTRTNTHRLISIR